MTDKSQAAEIAGLSFEDAMAELEAIVKALESGEARLDDAISNYERGALLKAHCERKLKDAQAKIERIGQSSSAGELEAQPFEME